MSEPYKLIGGFAAIGITLFLLTFEGDNRAALSVAAAGSIPSQCPSITTEIGRHSPIDKSANSAIRQVQRFLGEYFGVSINTGEFGPATEAHLKRFQREKGLPETGVTDQNTRLAIRGACNVVSVETLTTPGSEPREGEPQSSVAFRLSRTGPTTYTLPVPIAFSGTATYGVDYPAHEGNRTVRFAPGESSVVVTIAPLQDDITEDVETVTLSVREHFRFTRGTPSEAEAHILDGTSDGTPAYESDPQYDFLVMDVCVDENDEIIRNVVPGDAACTLRRNVREGESLPYHKHAFPNINSTNCKLRLGTPARDSIPITINGVTRVAIINDHGVDESCPGVTAADNKFGVWDRGGMSPAWFDDAYSFIMGSWSPEAFSYFYGPLCTDPNASTAFFRGWVSAPKGLFGSGGGGMSGYEVMNTKLHNGPRLNNCPADHNQALFTWSREPFPYKGGKTFDSVISNKFAGSSPRAKAFERTYWTSELGFTRWEAWKREDNTEIPVLEWAGRVYAAQYCSKPHNMPQRIGEYVTGPALTDGNVYSERIRGPDGVTYTWYMTSCTDYTNLVRDPAGLRPAPWAQYVNPEFWY